MSTQELISKIDLAVKLEDVIDVNNFKTEFNSIVKEIHPDVCDVVGADKATLKLNEWKKNYEMGKEYKDEVGVFRTNGYWLDFKSDKQNLNWSIENYRLFMQLQDDSDKHFQKYLPKECKLLSDGRYRFQFDKRSIPLSGLVLPQEHVNWVLNRLLEYCAYLSQIGFSHCGLTPESVFIIPETHGIQVCSFYHLTRLGNRMKTVCGKYMNWYPTDVITNKMGVPMTDLECAKRIAAYLLGDTSGIGIKFKKTHNEDFINFILKQHSNSYQCLTEYKALLAKNFKKQFHLLTI